MKVMVKGKELIHYDYTGTLHPADHIKISIIVPTINIDKFRNLVLSLTKTCSNPELVEILIKVDQKDLDEYQKILDESPFSSYLLSYPTHEGYWDLHIFINDLGKLANGDLIWAVADDMTITSNDWVDSILNSYKVFSDKIYVYNMQKDMELPGVRYNLSAPKMMGPYILTKEWMNVLGTISPFPETNVWLSMLSLHLRRHYYGPRIDFEIEYKSWKIHKRYGFLDHANWPGVKKNLKIHAKKIAPLFLKKMTDPKRTENISWRGHKKEDSPKELSSQILQNP
jgi:hypothetical protein